MEGVLLIFRKGYERRIDKRNTDIRQNLKIFSLGEEIEEYQ
jgi:hypothetical protein